MKHPERVEDYLEHIAEAIDRATSYLQPVPDLEAFQENRQVQDAVVRNIEIIGEAVSKIQSTAPDFIKQHAELPWAQMRGMRNVTASTSSTFWLWKLTRACARLKAIVVFPTPPLEFVIATVVNTWGTLAAESTGER